MNGKGDKDRTKDLKQFKKNYDKINWKTNNKKCNKTTQNYKKN